jgi:hypothetical protein
MVRTGIGDAAVTLGNVADTVVRQPERDRNRSTTEDTMLPLPTVRTSPGSLRRLARRIDEYTLWAFNPQRPLGR